jgi:glutamate-1-semialdehyde 2,1-aminomutase
VPVQSTLVGLSFGAQLPVDYASAKRTDEAAYARFFHALLHAGVAVAPGAYEVMFPGLAHDDSVVDELIGAAERASAAAFG